MKDGGNTNSIAIKDASYKQLVDYCRWRHGNGEGCSGCPLYSIACSIEGLRDFCFSSKSAKKAAEGSIEWGDLPDQGH
jgi:hypothetical protein